MNRRSPSEPHTLTASGGVLWRGSRDEPEVLLVHRPRYDDWSLPKGKPDAGEHILTTAVREVTEETGLQFRVGVDLGRVRYLVDSKLKYVRFWAMQLDERSIGDPRPEDVDEVDDFVWLPATEAIDRVSYPTDQSILRNFVRIGTTPISLLLIRHAHAGQRSKWPGPDDLRPLSDRGERQTAAIAALLPAFEPTAVLSAVPDRCVQTARPLAEALGLPLEISAPLSERSYEEDPQASLHEVARLALDSDRVAAISQGGVIRPVLERLLPGREARYRCRKGGMWAFGVRDGRLITFDYYPTLLPD